MMSLFYFFITELLCAYWKNKNKIETCIKKKIIISLPSLYSTTPDATSVTVQYITFYILLHVLINFQPPIQEFIGGVIFTKIGSCYTCQCAPWFRYPSRLVYNLVIMSIVYFFSHYNRSSMNTESHQHIPDSQ